MVWGSLPSRMMRSGVQAGLRCARTKATLGSRAARRRGIVSAAVKVPFPAFSVAETAIPVLADLPLLQIAHPLACQEPEGDEDGDGR